LGLPTHGGADSDGVDHFHVGSLAIRAASGEVLPKNAGTLEVPQRQTLRIA